MIRCRCTTSIFKIPNLFRGLPGEGKDKGFPLPFSVNGTQIILFAVFLLISIPITITVGHLTTINNIIRIVFFSGMLPAVCAYSLGLQQKNGLNIIQYWILKFRTMHEPNDLIGLSEVDQAKSVDISQKIKVKKCSGGEAI